METSRDLRREPGGGVCHVRIFLVGRYPNKDIYLSVFKGNDVAAGLYKEFGFRFNGEKDIHGEDVMVMRM